MEGLEGFSHLWILFIFDRTQSQWRPKVWPPRSKKKVGLWASRSPHRPNPIGMTAVKILSIEGPTITVQGHDLMNQTPIVDIKPYLTYADSIPDARLGWLETEQEYSLEFSERAKAEVAFLEKQGLTEFSSALHQQLRFHPTDRRRKRVRPLKSPAATAGSFCFSYRTWRVDFHLDDTIVYIHGLRSGYEPEEILLPEDPHNDKDLHRRFTHWQRGAFF